MLFGWESLHLRTRLKAVVPVALKKEWGYKSKFCIPISKNLVINILYFFVESFKILQLHNSKTLQLYNSPPHSAKSKRHLAILLSQPLLDHSHQL